MDQEGYLNELLRQREVKDNEKSIIPAPKEWMVYDQFPAEFSQAELKDAQSRTGELLWLAQRCRLMSILVSKDPGRCARIGKRILSYVNATRGLKLHYRPNFVQIVRRRPRW